jgi:PIN domain nuclease of toxin-antitoxin system
MTLLLDTHALLWFLGEPERLRAETLERIRAAESVVFVSAVSVWEIEVKRALGKLEIPGDLESQISEQRFTELPVHIRHVRALRSLAPLHRDPFDRMLAAQALADNHVLVTADERLFAYPIKTLRA